MTPIPQELAEALTWFWRRVDKTPTCWLWTGAKSGGYGSFNRNGKTHRAHRFSYELTAKIPDGRVLDHICRVRHCVNPARLEAVDGRTNILRGISPTAINARKVKCGKGHSEWGKHTNGTRKCLACYRDMAAKRVWPSKRRSAEQKERENMLARERYRIRKELPGAA